MNIGSRLRGALLTLAALAATVFLGGCSGDAVDVGVYIDPDIEDIYGYCPTFEVDIVGLNETDRRRFLKYDVQRYFEMPGHFRRSLNPVTLKFSDQDLVGRIIPGKAPNWKVWEDKGAEALGVIVNLPLVTTHRNPARDPRKSVLVLGDKLHNVLVGAEGARAIDSPPAGVEARKLSRGDY